MNNVISLALPVVKSIALAIVIAIVGLLLIKFIVNRIKKFVGKSSIDASLKPYIVSMSNIALKILLIISIISILGIDTASFAALIAAAGLAIGFAFQGSLSNFAGGILLLLIRPFSVGDYVEANGYSGTVQAIQILYTELVTVDNKVIFIPNGNLSNNNIVNYSIKDTRRVDFQFGVGYESDSERVKSVLREIIESHSSILKDPEPFVRLSEHGDRAIVFTVRVWVKASDYWDVHFDMMETVKKRFDEENISIPFPQVDVHMNK